MREFSVIAPQYGTLSVLTTQSGCLLFRAPKYDFLFRIYQFFNLILIEIRN
jgi:hypothetical protein